MINNVISFLASCISGAFNVFASFVSRLPDFFQLFFVALVMYNAVRFLLVPLMGRAVGSDRAGKKKNNSDGGESA